MLADASDMDSYSRTFWDTNIGGLGGEFMEIARRFIPEYRRNQRFNPLMNTMPDWLPNRFRYGDPFAAIPEGEGRMPGTGYESLNSLHPDMYGRYGAFDRFKILADIAPHSPEYKVWRAIAQAQVQDPDLKKEIKQIRKRVREQTAEHEFYDYHFARRGLEKLNITVGEIIDNNHFKAYGDDETIYRLAGIRVRNSPVGDKKTPEPTLVRYLHPGQEITLEVDENPNYRQDQDKSKSINANVLIGGESLNQQLLDDEVAIKRIGDTSAAATMGRYGIARRAWGTLLEYVAHADLPFVHDKFLRVRTAFESYKSEQVYGTPYQSWNHPWSSYLEPALERAVSSGPETIMGLGALAMHKYAYKHATNPLLLRAADTAFMFLNRGAFIGGFLGLAGKGAAGVTAMKFARFGAYAQALGYLATRDDQPAQFIPGMGAVGAIAGHLTGKGGIPGALAGLAAGTAVSAFTAHLLDNSRAWIPDRAQEKWELEEYFDRLTYIKYTGLFAKAAEQAEAEEGVNIKQLRENIEAQKISLVMVLSSMLLRHNCRVRG